MVKVFLYDNGFEIKGHTDFSFCHAIGLLAWAFASSIKRVDNNSYFDTMSGYTWSLYDEQNEKANYLHQEFKKNLIEWAESQWYGKVEVNTVDGKLHKTDEEKLNSSP